MNDTWFASAYDDGSVPFRVATFVLIAGALTMAGGVPAFFTRHSLGLIVGGYIVTRLAMIRLWLSAAAGMRGTRPVRAVMRWGSRWCRSGGARLSFCRWRGAP